MADIHILEGHIQDEDRASYRYVLHIPTDASPALKAKATLDSAVNSFESALGNAISPAELDQIHAGDLVEELHTIVYHKNDPASEYLARVRAQWVERAAVVPDDFERRYQWYASEYAHE